MQYEARYYVSKGFVFNSIHVFFLLLVLFRFANTCTDEALGYAPKYLELQCLRKKTQKDGYTNNDDG